MSEMADDEFNDIDQRLQEYEDRIREASERCHNRTVIRLAREARRLARQEHRLIPYLTCSFHLINSADDVLENKLGCEVSVEMIALLEDEDRARQFQADLPQDEYDHSKWWLTGYTYKKLAILTGNTQGYNSDGMHQCISDGMNVCRRTGNLRETLHFREFAVEVYRAADDLDMALHFARGSLELQDGNDSNRKVASADDVASLLKLQGNLSAAVEMVQLGWQHCLEFHNPYLAQLNFLPLAREVACMSGRQDLLDTFPVIVAADTSVDPSSDKFIQIPPVDESPYFTFLRDQTLSVEVACQGNYDRAIQLLQPWDRRLAQEECLANWFGVRCRLIALCRLAGRMEQGRALAKPCEVAAKKSRDWLTLRRLSCLLDESFPVNPLAMVGEADCGPFATRQSPQFGTAPIDADAHGAEPQTSAQGTVEMAAESPMHQAIRDIHARLQLSEGTPEELAGFRGELLAITPDTIMDGDDAARLLQLARFVVGRNVHDVADAAGIGVVTDTDSAGHQWNRTVLDWADAIVKRFLTNAIALSMFATLVARVRETTESDVDDIASPQRIESLFRQSLDLDASSASNFARAGLYHLGQHDFGEAERCLARGFRLERTSAILASSLAEVYSSTDRPRDALAVLDMALREGCEDPDVAWEAAMRANSLEQYEATLTYLDRYDHWAEGRPWANHYRAFALLEMSRPQEALVALDREAEFNPEMTYQVHLQRASALGSLQRESEFRVQLVELLSIPLTTITYLSPGGLQRLFHRLWLSSTLLAEGDPLRTLLCDHLVATGLASNGFFESMRIADDGAVPESDIRFFSLTVRQSLDERWRTSRGCLAGEEDWTSYEIAWGVLAKGESDARDRVLRWQQRCFPAAAEILDVQSAEETYQDFPGIVWQGQREGQLATG